MGGCSTLRPDHFNPGNRDPVPIVQEAAWAPGSVWTGAGYLASTGIRSPVCPIHSDSLYRLNYRGPLCLCITLYESEPWEGFEPTSHCSSSPNHLTFSRLMTHTHTHTHIYIYIYIYMSYRTANLQMLHFIYLFNKYTY